MKSTYKVKGMSCNGCKTNVERVLNELEGVEIAQVDLQRSEVSIKMTTHISLETLKETFAKGGLHYKIELLMKRMLIIQ